MRGPLQSGSDFTDPIQMGQYRADYPDSPNQQPGFEIRAADQNEIGKVDGFSNQTTEVSGSHLAFVPDYYPDRFVQTKEKELERNGRQCAGESVSIDTIKNRDFHVKGVLLEYEVAAFQQLIDHEGPVEILSPLSPRGGMECIIKQGELGNNKGYDPHAEQWMFEYMVDLVSTGDDEYDRGRNAIVSAIIDDGSGSGGGGTGGGGMIQ